jgi:hypothetical protein
VSESEKKMYLPPEEYESLVRADNGIPLTDLFPCGILATIKGDEITDIEHAVGISPGYVVGREHLKMVKVLKGGHPSEEHSCTRACLMPAGAVEYICTVHGKTVYGNDRCPYCVSSS